ncbi:hypothetical protein ACOI1C_10850 [Bacillus sp. DJP31]|uniref:hypothetical protein n=1 Tax=Bacillus sp. DJP31 TaxID=3409789 RepID=UPI003BB49C3E
MTMFQYEVFVKVVDTGNFTRAGEIIFADGFCRWHLATLGILLSLEERLGMFFN